MFCALYISTWRHRLVVIQGRILVLWHEVCKVKLFGNILLKSIIYKFTLVSVWLLKNKVNGRAAF
jgi:hypothetical protein